VPCNDLDASEAFYARLGFHRSDEARPADGSPDAYRILHDRLAAILKRDIIDVDGPSDKPRSMYEFAVSDPDSTLVRIGSPTRLRGVLANGVS
jgi:catechol 2,3-dioxygenase-like lactoylglutathione lyase family enzyme